MKTTTKKKAKAVDITAAISEDQMGKKLPRGASSLPKEVALQAQKMRVIRATAMAVAEKGYAATTVTDIIKHASVSRTTFYELFVDKEACYLYGLRALAKMHLQAVQNAIDLNDSLADRGVKALTAYVERIDMDRVFAIAFVAEAESATPAVREAFFEIQDEFAKMLRAWLKVVQEEHPEVDDSSASTFRMLLAGLQSFVAFRARHGAEVQGETIQSLVIFTFATLGLYGWAKRAKAGSTRWGSPTR